jgi:hypothetical protein
MMLASWYVPPGNPYLEQKLTPHAQAKMVYASSKEALKRSLPGIAAELQANDTDDIEYE